MMTGTNASGAVDTEPPRLGFKEMCAKFDVTPRTLRYYEYIELIAPEREGRARWYGPREIARMTLILRGRRWGFALEDIRQWLELYEQEGSQAQLRSFVDLADRQLDELRARHDEIAAAIVDLEAMRDDLRGKIT